ncbi:MAG: hypothetical protein JXR22_11660, partial [Prolixibacteraceae bacterium]|nr:hypothetical protein [Prolixibacteraceae bacterium]
MRLMTFVVVCWLMSGLAMAQIPTYHLNPAKKLTQYNLDHWTTEDGLPTNSLLHIHQDQKGYLWITGYSGLIRFDGVKFTLFNNANTEVFNSNVIRNIAEDSQGRLWLSTQGNGLVSILGNDYKTYGADLNMLHLYRGILVDDQDRVWAASPESGWFYLENGKFNFLEYSSPLNNIEVRAIAQGHNGTIWFATLGDGLFRYQNGTLTNYHLADGLIDEWLYSLFVDESDLLWIGSSEGVCTFNGKQFQRVLPQIENTVNRILKDRFGDLWLGTTEGLYRKKNNTHELEHLSADNGLPGNFIIDFLFDAEGTMWMTKYKGGLTSMKDGKFTNYTYKGGLPNDVVNTICELNEHTFLVGFDNGEMVKINQGEIEPFTIRSNFEGTRIRHVMKDSRQNLWLSTYAGLLMIHSEGTEHWIRSDEEFNNTKARLTFEDSRGNIWVGTRNSGVFKITPQKQFKQFDVNAGLTSNLILSIEEDREGNIWVGTSEGLNGLNSISPSDIVTAYSPEDGFNSDIVFNITTDDEGIVWFSTITGLWAYRDFHFYNITTKNGLYDNSVFDLIADDHGFYWLPYASGIMRVNRDELIRCIHQEITLFEVRNYNKHDGMPTSECNPTSQAIRGVDGRLYFATLEGLAILDPGIAIINNYIPPVYVEKLVVDNKFIQLDSTIQFKPGNKRFTFHYTALSLYEPEKIQYEYQLDGFEKEWISTNERSVSYTNLPHGTYTFRVRACNNDGIWNQQGASISFLIQPRFTETILFYILLLVVSFSVVYAVYVWQITQMKRKQQLLEKIINDRTREVIDKNKKLEQQKTEIQLQNDVLVAQKMEIEKQSKALERQKEELKESIQTKEKIFSIISHDLRSPLGNIQNMLNLLIDKNRNFDADKKSRILENLAEITKSTFYLLDNLLNWSRSQRGLISYDPQMFLVAPIIDEIIGFTRHMASKKKIAVISRIHESDLAFGDLNMVKTIFRNFIENALKFTGENGKVEISSAIQGELVEFAISDSGIGMTGDMIDQLINSNEISTSFGTNREKGSGLGFLLCKDFIQKNGGTFRIES